MRALARDRLAPRAAHDDATAAFPWDNVKVINALGLDVMFVPEAYGGAQASQTASLECGKGDGEKGRTGKGDGINLLTFSVCS